MTTKAKKGKSAVVPVPVCFTPAGLKALDAAAAAAGVLSRSQFVRQAVEAYLQRSKVSYTSRPTGGTRVEAEKFLLDALKDGPVWQPALEVDARSRGISISTLRRAKERLDVESVRTGNAWEWRMGNPCNAGEES